MQPKVKIQEHNAWCRDISNLGDVLAALAFCFACCIFHGKKHQMSFWAPWAVWPNLKHTASVTGSQTAGRKPRAISRCTRFSTCACAFVVSLGNCGNNVHMACSNLTVFQNFRAVVGFWWRYPDVFCQGGDETNSRGEGVQDARELATREGFLMICMILWLYRYGIIYISNYCHVIIYYYDLD